MELTREQITVVARAAETAGLDFVRLFGSAVDRPESARDWDLAIGVRPLGLEELTAFKNAIDEVLPRSSDIVQLRPGLSPLLVKAIACKSRLLWENSSGRARYAVLIDRLFAVAEDELLSFPPELRDEAFKSVQERLRVS